MTSRKLFRFGLLLVAAIAVVGPRDAAAQTARYQTDEFDRSLSRNGRVVAGFLQTGSGDRAQFEEFFTRWYFPAMTRTTPEGLGRLGKLSNDLFKRYLHQGTGEPQKWLSDQALEWGKRVTTGRRYHPAVRMNALLIVGRIDDAYNRDDPTPSADANEFLCRVAGSAATNARAPRYLLTGALTGLERHTRHSQRLDRRRLAQTARVLLGVLRLDDLAGDYEEGVRDWVYVQAASAISNLRVAGRNGSLVLPVSKRAADESLSIETRAELASLLEKMKGSAPAKALVEPMVRLAADVARQEAEIAEQYEQTQVGGRRIDDEAITRDKNAGRIRAGAGTAQGGPTLVREPMVAILSNLQAGVQAANRLAGGEGQPMLIEIEQAIKPAIAAASETDESDVSVAAEVRRMARAIENVAAPMMPPEEGDEEEGVDPEDEDLAAAP